MAQSSYTERLKKATELATKATHLEASLSSLSPLVSPLPTLHKAFPLYISAAEQYSHLVTSATVPETDRAQIKKKWRLVLERAEKVKKRIESLGGHVGKVGLTDEVEEENILKRGGSINGLDLPVWDPSHITFEGDIRQPDLAKEQEELDPEWAEVDPKEWDVDFGKESWVIRQGPGADCSVVAGFGACLEHNRRWGTTLGQDALLPRSAGSKSGHPVRSNNGRHVAKLLLNGAWRSVLIDALLPRSMSKKIPLHATSHPEDEPSMARSTGPPWIPLTIKAYFKAHGGYSLRGSNPAPDIYTLTGWIPERIHLRDEMKREKEWGRIYNSWKRGKVIVTLGTGAKEGLGEGLIPYHAYAVLDLEETPAGDRLWKIYDPGITRQHAEELHLNDDLADQVQGMSLQEDGMTHSGMFTRSYDAVCAEFETLNLNWDPALKPNAVKKHWSWAKPENEEITPPSNLRYQLDIRSDDLKAGEEVWVLLYQHIKNQDRALDDIALHVQELSAGRPPHGARRLSHEERIAASSPYSNATHVLYRYPLRRPDVSLSILPLRDRGVYRTDFTLQAFAPAHVNISLQRISTTYPFSTVVEGQLTARSAGGHAGLPSWIDNPQYRLFVTPNQAGRQIKDSGARIILQGESGLAWNAKVLRSDGGLVFEYGDEVSIADSGAYTYDIAYLDIPNLEAGTYTISTSAFTPGQCGKYTLSVESALPITLTPIPAEGAGMYSRVLSGVWTDEIAGGRPSGGTYDTNVRIEITIPRDCVIMCRSIMPLKTNTPIPLNITLFKRESGGKPGEQIATSGPYSDAVSGVSIPRTKIAAGVYVLVLSAWERGMGVGQKWENRIWTTGPLEVERVN